MVIKNNSCKNYFSSLTDGLFFMSKKIPRNSGDDFKSNSADIDQVILLILSDTFRSKRPERQLFFGFVGKNSHPVGTFVQSRFRRICSETDRFAIGGIGIIHQFQTVFGKAAAGSVLLTID